MAVDRGSLRYVIELDAATALKGLSEFRVELSRTRNAWRTFRNDIKSVQKDSRSVSTALNALSKEAANSAVQATKAAESAKARAAATKTAAVEAQKDAKATKQQSEQTRLLTVEQKKLRALQATIARERRFNSNKQIRELQQTLGIIRQVTKAEDKLARIKRLSSQGRDTQTGELREQRTKRQLLEAQNALEREQSTLNNKELITLQAQLAVTRQQIRLEQERLRTKALADQGRLATGLTVQETGLAQFNRELEQLKIQKVRKDLEEANPEFQRLKQEVRGTGKAVEQAAPKVKRFSNVLENARGRANSISFTFRRLIGIFAAFTIIRQTIGFFNSLVVGAVKFNAAIEQTVLGVASLFTAVGDVRDATGESVGATERLNLAQRESRRQIDLLRKDALATVATFQELADTFQVAIAPGVDAGLGIDQIRKFSVQISQAAAAIGLQQNQLAEEIRSILAGTIQLRTTRIAAALGITNEEIRQAKELGVLAEFLADRFDAFTVAGETALTLFNAVLARVRDSFQELLRQGSVEFFEELKGLLDDVFEGLTDINEEGIQINPDAVGVVRALFDGLRRAIVEARRLLRVLDLSDFEDAARNVGNLIGIAAESIGSIVQGFINGVKKLSKLLGPVAKSFASILPGDNLQEQLRLATELLTVVVGLRLSWLAIASTLSLVLAPLAKLGGLLSFAVESTVGWGFAMKAVQGLFLQVRSIVAALIGPLGVVVAAAVFAALEIGRIALAVFGIEAGLETVAKLVSTTFVQAFRAAAAQIKFLFTTITTGLEVGLKTIAQGFREVVYRVIQTALDLANALPGLDFSEELRRLDDERNKSRREWIDTTVEGAAKLKQAAKDLSNTTRDAARAFVDGVKEAIDEGSTLTFDEYFNQLVRESTGFDAIAVEAADAKRKADEFTKQMEEAATAGDALVESLSNLPGIFSRGDRDIKGLQETLTKLREDLQGAADEFSFTVDTQAISGVTEDLRVELAERRIRLGEEERGVMVEIEKQELAIAQAQAETLRLQGDAVRRYGDQAEGLTEIVRFSQIFLDSQREVTKEEAKLTNLVALRNAAVKAGVEDRAAAIEKDIASQEEQVAKLKSDASFGAGLVRQLVQSIGAVADGKFLELVEARVVAAGKEVAAAEELDSLLKQREKIEEAVTDLALQRIATALERQRTATRERLIQLDAELAAEQRLQAFRSSLRQDTQGAALAEAQGELGVEMARLRIIKERQAAQQAAQAENIQNLTKLNASQELITEALRAQAYAQSELNQEIELQELLVDQVALKVDEARRKLEEPFAFGFETAFANFEADATNSFEQFVQIGTTALEGFRDTAAGLLTGLFDPRVAIDGDAVRNAFGELFLQIANDAFKALVGQLQAQLLGQFFETGTETATATLLNAAGVQLQGAAVTLGAPATALLQATINLIPGSIALDKSAYALGLASNSLFGAAAAISAAALKLSAAGAIASGTSGIGSAFGAAGGFIPRSAAASLAHYQYGVHGYALGGTIRGRAFPTKERPVGIDKRDTVPIWAQRGEFMMRLRAVRLYGAEVMRALNSGLIDPMALRALASTSRLGSQRRNNSRGYAEGGLISDKIETSNTIAGRASRDQQQRSLLQRAIVVPDESTMERLLAMGTEAQQRWLEDNAADARASLSR